MCHYDPRLSDLVTSALEFRTPDIAHPLALATFHSSQVPALNIRFPRQRRLTE